MLRGDTNQHRKELRKHLDYITVQLARFDDADCHEQAHMLETINQRFGKAVAEGQWIGMTPQDDELGARLDGQNKRLRRIQRSFRARCIT